MEKPEKKIKKIHKIPININGENDLSIIPAEKLKEIKFRIDMDELIIKSQQEIDEYENR